MKRTLFLMLALVSLFGSTAASAQQPESRVVATPAWQPFSGPSGGPVIAFALSPNYLSDQTVFAGTRSHGVYRHTNVGDLWQPVSPKWYVIDVSISPNYSVDRTVFAAEGLPSGNFGIHWSIDAGDTWQNATAPAGGFQNLTSLVVSPNFANDHTVYAIGTANTYRSTDGGANFTQLGGWYATHALVDLAFSPNVAVDQTLFAIVRDDKLYKSIDGGANWNPTTLSGSLSIIAVSPDYANDQMLAAIKVNDGKLYTSTNGGTSFSPGTLTLTGAAGKHSLIFSPSFASNRFMLAASQDDPGAYRSIDGGATWLKTAWYDPAEPFRDSVMNGSVYALAISADDSSSNTEYMGSSTGVLRGTFHAQYWNRIYTGLPKLSTRAIAIAPGDFSTLLVGTSFFERAHNGVVEADGGLQLSSGGSFWRDVSGRLDQVQQVAFSPGFLNDHTAFAVTGFIGTDGYRGGGIYRSTTSAEHWDLVQGGIEAWSLALSPNYAIDHTGWVYATSPSMTAGVYVTHNGGDSWSLLAASVAAQTLVPSPNFAIDQTLFAGTPSGVQRSTNGGANWTQCLPYQTNALAVSPAFGASYTVYSAVTESSGAPGAIYRSTNGGVNWQKLNTGIPATAQGQPLSITSLGFAPDGSLLAGVVYGSSGGATYRSIDAGATWQSIDGGLSSYYIFDLISKQFYAEPHGLTSLYAASSNGLWYSDIVQYDAGEQGTWIGNAPRGGKANTLVVSPNFATDGIVFSGEWFMGRLGDQTGSSVVKSSNGGQTWALSAQGIDLAPNLFYTSAIHRYAISPNFASDHTVFVATWGGLFKSNDAGANWQWIPGLYNGAPGSIGAVAVAPNFASSHHMLASGGFGGLFVSEDGGVNWTANYSVTGSMTALAYSPNFAIDHIAFAAGFGVYKTTNGGMNWTHSTTASIASLVVSPNFAVDQTIFAGSNVLHTSTNGGTSWITSTIAPSITQIGALAISPNFANDQTLFAGANNGLYRSNNAGSTWNIVTGTSGIPILSLAISPGWPGHSVLLVGSDHGVYRLANNTLSFTQGLITLTTSALTLSADETLWLVGAPNHGIYASSDGGASWSPFGLQGGFSYYGIADTAISPNYANDHTVFAAQGSGVSIGAGVYRSIDSGAHWQNVYNTDSIPALAISPNYANDSTIFAIGNTGRVVSSTNGGNDWSSTATWPTPFSPNVWQVALPPNYASDATVFAAGDGFYRLPPGASIWQLAASGLLSDTTVTTFAIAPNYTQSHTLLAVASPPSTSEYSIFRSSDGGVNWQASGIGLPNLAAGNVAFSPNYASDRTAYAKSANQFYRSTDDGHTWTTIDGPPGWPALGDLAVTHDDDVIFTSNTGVWRYRASTRDILIDGDFEANNAWSLPATTVPANYTTRVLYDGLQAMRIGIDNGNNVATYSSARQTVTIPISISAATLNVRLYPASGEAPFALNEQGAGLRLPSADALRAEVRDPSSATAGDSQYVLILEPTTYAISQTLLLTLSNAQVWQPYHFDLTPYAGRTIVLHFGVYNDGAGGRTAMFADEASLLIIGELPNKIYLPFVLKN